MIGGNRLRPWARLTVPSGRRRRARSNAARVVPVATRTARKQERDDHRERHHPVLAFDSRPGKIDTPSLVWISNRLRLHRVPPSEPSQTVDTCRALPKFLGVHQGEGGAARGVGACSGASGCGRSAKRSSRNPEPQVRWILVPVAEYVRESGRGAGKVDAGTLALTQGACGSSVELCALLRVRLQDDGCEGIRPPYLEIVLHVRSQAGTSGQLCPTNPDGGAPTPSYVVDDEPPGLQRRWPGVNPTARPCDLRSVPSAHGLGVGAGSGASRDASEEAHRATWERLRKGRQRRSIAPSTMSHETCPPWSRLRNSVA